MEIKTLYNAEEARQDLISQNEEYIRECIQKIKDAVTVNKTRVDISGSYGVIDLLKSVLNGKVIN